MNQLEVLFGVPEPVIAMLHFPGPPGRPRQDRAAGVTSAVDVVNRDLEVLQAASAGRGAAAAAYLAPDAAAAVITPGAVGVAALPVLVDGERTDPALRGAIA